MNYDLSYLLDIAHLCQTILRLTNNMTREEFLMMKELILLYYMK